MDSRSERLICEGANIYEGEFGRRVMSREGKQTSESILILCVDRDDDIGRKTGVKTPIIGKEDNMKSALKLILADPEEADANAMFEAIRLYNVLNKNKKSEEKYEIATISGSEIGGVTADRKLVAELGEVLKKFPADGLILVTDGFSDEDIMPLIKTRIPVTSVRRVVIKHSESIEETAALFSRYWRMIIEDPKYSRIALGLPGILLISLGILILLKTFIKFDIYTWIAIVGLIILGSYLLGKGYRIDRKISSITPRLYHYSISGMVESFSLTFGFILIGIGFYQAGSFIVSKYGLGFHFPMDAEKLIALLPLIIGWFINKIITLAIVGICTIFLGKSIAYLLERDARFWRTIALIVVSAWSWTILNEISRIILDPSLPPDGLVMSVIIGIAVIAVSGSATLLLSRKYRDLFKGKKKRKAEDAEAEGSS
ncbi:hypothetical protein DRO35_00625 [Candidatus Bathyarchaeota archaeon]|nr:MAG: hypothetical protein DRO35_00625 [Candidatus Bathyarchaeota archaeon]